MSNCGVSLLDGLRVDYIDLPVAFCVDNLDILICFANKSCENLFLWITQQRITFQGHIFNIVDFVFDRT